MCGCAASPATVLTTGLLLWVFFGLKDSVSLLPTLGPKVYRYDLLWALWSPRYMVLVLQDERQRVRRFASQGW